MAREELYNSAQQLWTRGLAALGSVILDTYAIPILLLTSFHLV